MAVPSKDFTFTNGPGNKIDATQVNKNFDELYDYLTGSFEADSLLDALAAQLGVSKTGQVRRGKSIVAAEESRANAAYGLMATPDRVEDVVLPADGLIFVAYRARWKQSVAGAARAAIFLGANQMWSVGYTANNTISNGAQEALIGDPADIYTPLMSSPVGLVSGAAVTGLDVAPAATGQALGAAMNGAYQVAGMAGQQSVAAGLCVIEADAGTYSVSVQYKASSGQVSAKGRKLVVWTLGG